MYASIATVCLSGSLREKVAAIANAGFKHIEIFENDLISFDGSVKDAASLVHDHGLQVVTLQPFRDFEGLPQKDRGLAFDRAKLKFEQMHELGTDLLMVCSSTHPNAEGGIARLADDFHELGEVASTCGMRVAFEALAWGKHINDYRDSWEVVRQANHCSVGLVLDTFHIFSRGTDLNAIANIPGDQIFLVQVADAPRLSMDHLSWSRHYRCFPGQGELNISSFMDALASTGYSGPLSHEIFNDIFRRSDPAQTALDGHRSLQYLLSMLPQHQVSVPEPVQLSGFDFVEIATQTKHQGDLQSLLDAIGFKHVGKHREMQAEHWRCGDVQFVLNSDPKFANQFLEKRGTGVVALGLKVDSAYATTKRANFMGVPVVEPVQVNALHNMVGMENVDGTVWYWVDASTSQHAFDSAFELVATGDEKMNDPLVERVDHISLSQSYPDFLSSLLGFKVLFDLNTAPAFDVFDPQGLIQSQVVHNDDRTFQLAFNATDAKNTSSARFIERAKGSGVQHIALATRDIFSCAIAVRNAGIECIRIPQNYYPDLQARFGLDDSLCQKLERYNILYDQDDNGEFFQLYTRPIEGRLFFEFVQRDGYQGLGAANAWLRASAQHMSDAAE